MQLFKSFYVVLKVLQFFFRLAQVPCVKSFMEWVSMA